jgi:hypothetical protein
VPFFWARSTTLVPGLLNWDWGWDSSGYFDSNDPSSSPSSAQSNGDDQQSQPNYSNEQQGEYVPPPPPSEPLARAAVTLVFKNGRSQQVRNYAIKGSTLYVLDDAASGRTPEISLSSIDAAATRKANQALGVDFNLPVSAN